MEPQNISSNEKLSPEHVDLQARFVSEENMPAHMEMEHVSENVKEKIHAENDAVYTRILSQVKTPAQTNAAVVSQDAHALKDLTDRESQISHLLDLAMTKGLVHAVKVAQHTNDYYMLDQLHDRMCAEDFYQALVAKGLIEK